MDQPGQTAPPMIGVATGVPYAAAAAASAGGPYQAYQHLYQQQQQQQQQQLQMFWADQYREIEQTTDFKNHSLPLARIKKIMKADEDRRTLQKNDIAAAVSRTDVFDFLIDIVPREEGKEDVARPLGAPSTDPMSYYYLWLLFWREWLVLRRTCLPCSLYGLQHYIPYQALLLSLIVVLKCLIPIDFMFDLARRGS
ncbi:unnamed protein product, partial [Musa hybrid cultivar]